MFHYREDRIRAHIQLCWLALLLLRVIENATGDTRRNIRREVDRMHLVTLATNAGQIAQRTTTTTGQQTLSGSRSWPSPLPATIEDPATRDDRRPCRSVSSI